MELERLRKKYESILELRLRKASTPHVDDSEVIRALAREFPGALRDLDALSLAEVHDRIALIVAAELDPVNMEPWMIAELTFYAQMRGALTIKSWLGKRRDITREIRDACVRDTASHPFAEDANAWSDDLAIVAKPPGGRLVNLAMSRVAGAMKISEREARALVFRHPSKAARLS